MSNLCFFYLKRFFFFLAFNFFFLFLKAQSSIELNLQKSIRSFSAEKNKLQGNAYGGEFIYHFNVGEKLKQWSKDLALKSIDVIFNFKRMHNVVRVADPIEGEFGDSYGLMGGFTLPLFHINKLALAFTPGLGIIYAGESWFTNENPVIGSKINLQVKAGLKASMPLNPKTALSLNLDILHYSNSAYRVPNNGLNIFNLGMSVARDLGKGENKLDKVPENEIRKHSFDLGISVGRRGVYKSRDGLWKTGLFAGYNYRVNSFLAMGAGLDAVYYHSVYDPGRNLETYQSKASSFERWRVGAAIGPDLWLGRFAAMIKYGYYIFYKSVIPMNTYWTAGVKYKLNKWLALQSKIYVHETEADHVGFGLILTK